jgi:hypothetical protein
MKRRIAFSVISIRDTSGSPPVGGSVAATIENLMHIQADPQHTSVDAIEAVTSDMAGPPSRSYAVAVTALNTRDVNPRQTTQEDQPQASILTSGVTSGPESDT